MSDRNMECMLFVLECISVQMGTRDVDDSVEYTEKGLSCKVPSSNDANNLKFLTHCER